ncbi:MAG: 1-acyl-sn-glycerol-3-phosphate acyltransferase [Gammaproteobacteria bacterium]|nr:1-acyl-sn-glycerol-3-phosphate acyltransferase [Gammaproteobacteria bacterium]MDH5651438.1 1-acyl-sn-glycerol-3-phosphate acyltransferase [Gammaproteobacteria bacterium]
MYFIRTIVRLSHLVIHIGAGLLQVAYARFTYGPQWYETGWGIAAERRWMQRACRILAVRIKTCGMVSAVRGTLFVANHISWLDIITLASVIETRFLAKDNVRSWPLIGALTASVGSLFIVRGRYFVIKKVAAEIKHTLNRGRSVLIFPEGTTTDGRTIGRFHSGLFKAVSEDDHFVQPIALSYFRAGRPDPHAPYIGSDTFLAHLFRIASQEVTDVTISFTPPIYTAPLMRNAIADLAQAQIRNARGEQAAMPVQAAAGLVA